MPCHDHDSHHSNFHNLNSSSKHNSNDHESNSHQTQPKKKEKEPYLTIMQPQPPPGGSGHPLRSQSADWRAHNQIVTPIPTPRVMTGSTSRPTTPPRNLLPPPPLLSASSSSSLARLRNTTVLAASSPLLRCVVCQFSDCDLSIVPCGCAMHARCVPWPLLLVLNHPQQQHPGQAAHCPYCATTSSSNLTAAPLTGLSTSSSSARLAPMTGLQLWPLELNLLDQAANVRLNQDQLLSTEIPPPPPLSSATSSGTANTDGKGGTLAETPSSSSSSSMKKPTPLTVASSTGHSGTMARSGTTESNPSRSQPPNPTTSSGHKRKNRWMDEDATTRAESTYLLLLGIRQHHQEAASMFMGDPSGAAAVLQPTPSLSSSWAADVQRTGRWTDQEVALVDFLVDAFEQSSLILPTGTKLHEFLCQLLLCKPSRLTKKMKSAKFSLRSYTWINLAGPAPLASSPMMSYGGGASPTVPQPPRLDGRLLSSLQEAFLNSMANEATRLELRFHMMKTWRIYFFNVFLQCHNTLAPPLHQHAVIGSSAPSVPPTRQPWLDASHWLRSLEVLERRAVQAEQVIKEMRRRRLGMALLTDVKQAASTQVPASSSASGDSVSPWANASSEHHQPPAPSSNLVDTKAEVPSGEPMNDTTENSIRTDVGQGEGMVAHWIELGPRFSSTSLEDFAALFEKDDLEPLDVIGKANATWESQQTQDDDKDQGAATDDGSTGSASSPSSGRTSSYLSQIVRYMEKNDLPFHHADVWVPVSIRGGHGKPDELRLVNAGFATRTDLPSWLMQKMNEYGEYSVRFSFAPGVRLPGYVFQIGRPSWECGLDRADANFFTRAGGAKVYGVKSAVGIPIMTNSIGHICVCLYSFHDVPRDNKFMDKCTMDLNSFCCQPKIQLVVESSSEDPAPLFSYKAAQPVASQPLTNLYETGAAATEEDEDHAIATLLGNHMPYSDSNRPAGDLPSSSSSSQGTSSGAACSVTPSMLLPHFMSLRLLLLRDKNRRSDEDNELLEVIKKSYRSYAQEPGRDKRDVAYLLVRDWQYMKAANSWNAPQGPPKAQVTQQPVMPGGMPFLPNAATSMHQRPEGSAWSGTGPPAQVASNTMAQPLQGGPFTNPSRTSRSYIDSDYIVSKKRRYEEENSVVSDRSQSSHPMPPTRIDD